MPKRKPPIPLYFTALEIENVRCFGDRQRLDLTAENGQPSRWTLILGDNGVGKTTLLQCLVSMRLDLAEEKAPHESGQSDGSGEPPPLTRGRLGPALGEAENEILESLLRIGTGRVLKLGAELSFGASLSSAREKAKGSTLRGKSVKAGVRLHFDAKRRLSEINPEPRRWPRIETKLGGEFHEPLVIVYGANRQHGVDNLAQGDLDNPLDNPTAISRLTGLTELYDVEKILSDLDYASKERRDGPEMQQLERLRTALARILPGDEFKPADIEIHPPDVLGSGGPSGVCLRSFSGLVPLSALSLGYQTTLAWAGDLAWRLLKRYPGSPAPLAEPAVVLIDEIDLHLHPLWQLGIIDDLSAIFPCTQFVATSHSPLMVQVAEDANFVLLRKRETDVEIINDPEVIRAWRVDQILTSELFGVPSARNRHTEALFARRDKLTRKPSRSAKEEAELERLRLQISELPTAADPEDQRAMDLIRKAAALLKKHNLIEP